MKFHSKNVFLCIFLTMFMQKNIFFLGKNNYHIKEEEIL